MGISSTIEIFISTVGLFIYMKFFPRVGLIESDWSGSFFISEGGKQWSKPVRRITCSATQLIQQNKSPKNGCIGGK